MVTGRLAPCDARRGTRALGLWSLAATGLYSHGMTDREQTGRRLGGVRLRDLGPGFLTGVADDDPSNIATYSQVGARFGYRMVWTVWAFFPLVAAVQEISAQIVRVTGRGLTENLRAHFPLPVCYVLVASLLIANIANIGADLLAMGGAARLLFGGERRVYALGFLVLIVALEVFVRYERYAHILEGLSLALLAYVATAFSVHADWRSAVMGLVPTIIPTHHYAMALVAIAGTTISPYLLFWQAGQEAEIPRWEAGQEPLVRKPRQARRALRRIRVDTFVGMGFSQAVALFITITAAATLGVHGVRHVDTAAQAANALRPFAGRWTSEVFTAGLVATGLLAIPAMAGACAYALAGLFSWREGLHASAREAPRFYLVITLVGVASFAVPLLGISSMRALYLSAVLNGLVAPPLLVCLMILAHGRPVMGRFALKGGSLAVGWLATAVMLTAAGFLIGKWLMQA